MEPPSAAELLAMIVHDLNNPLASVVGNAEYLSRALELSEDSRAALAELSESARLVERVAGDASLLAQTVAGRFTPTVTTVELRSLADAAVAEWRARAERLGVVVEVAVDGESAARIDADIVRRGLRALLGLALRRAPSGSRVQVTVGVRGDRAMLRVADAGPAIPAPRLLNLFGSEGGIAMLLTRALFEAAGGTTSVESGEPGLATIVELPVTTSSSTR